MPNRDFQDYANSGELIKLNLGGTGADNEVVPKNETGLMAFSNSADLVIPLTTTFSKVALFDVVLVNSARGHMTYDDATKRMTLLSDGVYKFRADGAMECANNVEVEFTFYKNGVQFNPAANPVFVGRGAGKPVNVSAQTVFSFTADDYLEIWAKIGSAGNITMKSSSITIEKTTY